MKNQSYYRLFIGVTTVSDVLLLVVVFRIATAQLPEGLPEAGREGNSLLLTIVLGWLVLLNVFEMNQPDRHKNAGMIVRNLSMLYLPFLAFMVIYTQAVLKLEAYTLPVLITITLFISVALIARILLKKLYDRLHQIKSFRKKAVIVGYTAIGRELHRYFSGARYLGIEPLGFFDDHADPQAALLGKTGEVEDYVLKHNVHAIYVTQQHRPDLVKKLSKFAEQQFVRFYMIPEISGLEGRVMDYNVIHDLNMPILSPRREPLRFFYNLMVKRMFDLAVSSVVLVTIFPVLYLIIGLAIRLESKGPVFFMQTRIGHKGRLFRCYKFRSMSVNTDADQLQASREDPRITRIGKFLRKTSLDEFPQFINVFKGEMSVVGPRPHMIKHDEEYSKLINAYAVRHFAPTGITGYAQINGFRGETLNLEDMRRRVELDKWYLNHWSLRLDIRIMLTTVYRLVAGDPKAY